MNKYRVLLLGNTRSRYVQELTRVIRNAGHDVDLLDFVNNRRVTGSLETVRSIVPTAIKWIPRVRRLVREHNIRSFLAQSRYDICSIQSNSPVYGERYGDLIGAAGRRLVISVWGSDFNKATAKQRAVQGPLCERADRITFNSESLRRHFAEAYPDIPRDRLVMMFYGSGLLDEIARLRVQSLSDSQIREALGIPVDRVIVAAGHNGVHYQQHLSIIQALQLVRDKLKERVFVVAPMTYGATEEYKSQVRGALRKSGFEFRLFGNRMTERETALLRMCTDIMIHMQTDDSFSAAMQEHLYAGTLVVNGAWLQYESLDALDVYYERVLDFKQLGERMPSYVNRLSDFKARTTGNRDKIWSIGSWETNGPRWERFLEQLMETKQCPV